MGGKIAVLTALAALLVTWSNKGNVLVNLSRYDEAVKAYDEAIKLKHNWALPWTNKANALNALGKYEEFKVGSKN